MPAYMNECMHHPLQQSSAPFYGIPESPLRPEVTPKGVGVRTTEHKPQLCAKHQFPLLASTSQLEGVVSEVHRASRV